MALVDTTLYNGLPSLEESVMKFGQPSIEELVGGPIRDVFIKYGAHADFCLYLQHRHHHLRHGQAIVKVNGTAHLMGHDDINDVERMGNKVVPATWMGSELFPAEFAIAPACSANTSPKKDFMDELSDVLTCHGLAEVFGVDTKAERNWSELTIGDASVMVPNEGTDVDGYYPVAFAFDKNKPSFTVHGRCGTDHKHTSKVS